MAMPTKPGSKPRKRNRTYVHVGNTPLQRMLLTYKRRQNFTFAQIAEHADAHVQGVLQVFHGRRGRDTQGLKPAKAGERPILFRIASALEIPNSVLRQALERSVLEDLRMKTDLWLYD